MLSEEALPGRLPYDKACDVSLEVLEPKSKSGRLSRTIGVAPQQQATPLCTGRWSTPFKSGLAAFLSLWYSEFMLSLPQPDVALRLQSLDPERRMPDSLVSSLEAWLKI